MQAGGFSEESLSSYQHLLSECVGSLGDMEGVYDFTRCVRPDGTTYGTKGKCTPPNKPAAAEAPETPEQPSSGKPPKEVKMKVSMGGYSTNLNVNTRGV